MEKEIKCPHCGCTKVYDHRDPIEKKYGEEHWYCSNCKADW